MTPEYARLALRQLVSRSLAEAGWVGAEASALGEIEALVLQHLGNLVHHAQELANTARRTRPQARDIIAACNLLGTSLGDLDKQRLLDWGTEMANENAGVEKERPVIRLVEIPPSKNHQDHSARPRTLDIAPDKYPDLPHEHLYRQTPVFQTISSQAQDTTQIQLDHRAAQSRLIEESLRNLVKATDAAAAPPARKPGLKLVLKGESVPIVNWELVNAVETASSSNLKRVAASIATPQAQKRIRVSFS